MGFLQQFVATAPAANRGMLEGISAGEEFRKAGMRLDAMRQQEAINRGLLAEEAGAAPRLNIGQGMDVVDVPTPQQPAAPVKYDRATIANLSQPAVAQPKEGEVGYGLARLEELRKQYEGIKGLAAGEPEKQAYDYMTGLPIGGENYTPMRDEQARLKALIDTEQAKVAAARTARQRIDQIDAAIAGRAANDPIRQQLSAEREALYKQHVPYQRAPKASEMKLDVAKPQNYFSALEREYSLPAGLLNAVMMAESGGRPGQTSDAGAQGYFQFMPDTAKQYGVQVNNLQSEATGAAKMLRDLLKAHDGNLEAALASYNWGVGNVQRKGMQNMPAETQAYIPKVLGYMQNPTGSVQVPTTGAEPAKGTAEATQAASKAGLKSPDAPDFVKPAKWYAANPDAINRDMQLAMDDRERLVRLANVYRNAGAGEQYFKIVEQVKQHDNNLYALQGVQGLAEFTPQYGYDSRRLAAVWSAASGGQPHAIQPRSDGKFNLFVNGQLTQEGLSYTAVSTMARNAIDATFRKEQAAAKAALAGKQIDTALDIEKERAKNTAQMVREIAVERTKGDVQMGVEFLKKNAGWEVKPTGNQEVVMITPPGGGAPMVMNTSGKTVSFEGREITAYEATPVSGLPLMSQRRLLMN